jgi:hypothetical protein
VIKEALEYLAGLQTPKNPVIVEVNSQKFAVTKDGTLGEAVRAADLSWPKPVLSVGTLSGIVKAYGSKVGKLGQRVALHVVNYMQVDLIDLDEDEHGKRRIYATAKHQPDTSFRFNEFMDPEKFLLSFRASFYFNEEAVKVQQLCSTVGAASGVVVADDGISQEVTVKLGTVTKAGVVLPADGVPLIAWRTFRDASPVQSRFLLRMRGVKDALPQIALFEIDAKWQLDTVGSIRKYLEGELPDATVIA